MLQWNLSNVDTVGTKIIGEGSLFQRENNMYLYKVGTQSSVLINQVSLFQRCTCPLSGVPVFHYRGSYGEREERWYCNGAALVLNYGKFHC